jgi:hypothetical protein
MPIRIANVANSVIHLMGIQGLTVENLNGVYHFTGNSALFALNSLLKICQPSTDDLIGPQLLPLLRCWDEGRAILAKAPLAFFYGMLCRNQIKQRWSIIWSVSEPLFLVASNTLVKNKDGQKIAESIVAHLHKHRQKVLTNPEQAAKRVRSEGGFLSYCKRMLLGNSMNIVL